MFRVRKATHIVNVSNGFIATYIVFDVSLLNIVTDVLSRLTVILSSLTVILSSLTPSIV